MALEDLTLRMRAIGSRSTSRDVDRVGRSVRRAGNDSRRSSANVTIFSRALTVVSTRAVIATFAVTLLGASLVALVPALLLVTAAGLALGAVFIPTFALIAGVVQRFHDTAGIAGSAASELTDVLAGLKSAWNSAVSPGAAIVMRGMSKAIVMLLPLIRQMEPVLTLFAKAMAAGMEQAAVGINALGPDLIKLFTEASTFIEPLTTLILAFSQAFIHAAIAGAPAAHIILGWLIGFAFWLDKAVGWMDRFGHSQQASDMVAKGFSVVAAVAMYAANVVSDLAGIVAQLWEEFGPLVSGTVLFALVAVAGTLDWINKNFDTMAPLLMVIVKGYIAYRVAALALAAGIKAAAIAARILAVVSFLSLGPMGMLVTTFWALNAALYANPIGVVILALVALAGLLYLAYTKSETFRSGVNALWGGMKAAWQWITSNWGTIKKVLLAPFMPLLFVLKQIIGHLDDIKSFAGGVVGFGKKIGNALLPGNPFGGGDDKKKGGARKGRKAMGGPVGASGPYDVGERGKERLWLNAGDFVEPHGGFGGGGDYVIEATFVLPDGTFVAKQVLRAAKKKKASR